MLDNLTSLSIASIPAPQPEVISNRPETPAIATHLTYEQAEAILGPYLDVYLFTGRLSRAAGPYDDTKAGKVLFGPVNAAGNYEPALIPTQGVISIASVQAMADYLHACDHPDARSVHAPDWPKETCHWNKSAKAKAAVNAQVPSELTTALAYPGMNLELFHWHGAPDAARLAEILDGAEARPDELQRISEALGRLRASGRSSF